MRLLYRDMVIVTRGNWEAESGELFSAVTPIYPGVSRAFLQTCLPPLCSCCGKVAELTVPFSGFGFFR